MCATGCAGSGPAAGSCHRPPLRSSPVAGRNVPWNPWRALRERDHIDLVMTDLRAGDAIHATDGECSVILLGRHLDSAGRNAALAHELVHDERGGGAHMCGMPSSWAPVVAREEQAVEREVARRLVPADALATYVFTIADLGGTITVNDVAERFNVPQAVAELAMTMLLEERRKAS